MSVMLGVSSLACLHSVYIYCESKACLPWTSEASQDSVVVSHALRLVCLIVGCECVAWGAVIAQDLKGRRSFGSAVGSLQ